MGRTGDVAAFVPMKGHSERVPGKNLRPLAGRPLYRWIVDALRASGEVRRIVVDTDSERIADDVGATYGDDVEIVWRPQHLRGDLVAMHDILAHDVSTVPEDLFLQTHSTNPLLRPETIADAIRTFRAATEHDSLFSVTRLQTRLYDRDGQPINHDPRELLRTQDLPPVYEENSNIYLFTREAILATGRRVGLSPQLYEMPAQEAVDIDEEFDFQLAELLAERQVARD